MPIYPQLGQTSTLNSSTTPLTSGSTFTGTAEQNNYPCVGVQLKTDQDGTLYFDFSNDGINWDSTFPVGGFEVSANIPEFHTAIKLGRYFRVRLVNNGTDQTSMRLATYYGTDFVPSAAPLNQSLGLDSDAIVVRSTLAEDEIRIGRRSGVTGNTKWGFNADIDSGVAEVIAAQGGSYSPPTTATTYDITYNSTTDGLGSTGATQLSITHVDAEGLPATFLHTLGSDGSDTTTETGFGVNRVTVSASGSADVNTNDITIAQTGGNTEAFVPALSSVTQQAIFHTGSNHDAVAKFLTINALKISGGGGSPVVTVSGYVYNRTFSTKYLIFRHKMDTSIENSFSLNEPVGFTLSPTDTLWFEGLTDISNTSVDIRFSLVEYQRS